jgi:hypothetical protein
MAPEPRTGHVLLIHLDAPVAIKAAAKMFSHLPLPIVGMHTAGLRRMWLCQQSLAERQQGSSGTLNSLNLLPQAFRARAMRTWSHGELGDSQSRGGREGAEQQGVMLRMGAVNAVAEAAVSQHLLSVNT